MPEPRQGLVIGVQVLEGKGQGSIGRDHGRLLRLRGLLPGRRPDELSGHLLGHLKRLGRRLMTFWRASGGRRRLFLKRTSARRGCPLVSLLRLALAIEGKPFGKQDRRLADVHLLHLSDKIQHVAARAPAKAVPDVLGRAYPELRRVRALMDGTGAGVGCPTPRDKRLHQPVMIEHLGHRYSLLDGLERNKGVTFCS